MPIKTYKGARTLLYKKGDSHPCYVSQYAASDTGQDTRAVDTGTADDWVQSAFATVQYPVGTVFELYCYFDTGASNIWERKGVITKV